MEDIIGQLKELLQSSGQSLPNLESKNDILVYLQKAMNEGKKKIDKKACITFFKADLILTQEYISTCSKDLQRLFLELLSYTQEANKALVGIKIHKVITVINSVINLAKKSETLSIDILDQLSDEDKKLFDPIKILYEKSLILFEENDISGEVISKGAMDIVKAYLAKNAPEYLNKVINGMGGGDKNENEPLSLEDLKIKMRRLKKEHQRSRQKSNVKPRK